MTETAGKRDFSGDPPTPEEVAEVERFLLEGAPISEFADFVDSKAPALTCNVCGHRTFEILSDSGNRLQVFKLESRGDYFPQVGFACQNCGHLFAFNARLFMRWRKERQA